MGEMLRNSTNFNTLILRERLPDGLNRKMGWVILGEEQGVRERKLLAILVEEIGLDLAHQLIRLLAQKFKARQVFEELVNGERHELVEAAHYSYDYHHYKTQPIFFDQ